MTSPQPATIAVEIGEKLNQIVSAASRLGDFSPFSKSELIQDIEKLQKSDRFNADLLSAKVAHIDGDVQTMLAALKNANANAPGAVFLVRKEKTVFCANLLLASEVLQDANSVCDRAGDSIDREWPQAVAAIGGFQAVATLSKRVEKMKLQLENFPNMPTVLKAAEALRHLDVSDKQCAEVIDIAGNIMRGRGLLWKNRAPDFYVSPEGDFVKIDYRVAVSAKEAALMSFELLDGLIENNLAGLPFCVDFLGVAV